MRTEKVTINMLGVRFFFLLSIECRRKWIEESYANLRSFFDFILKKAYFRIISRWITIRYLS